MAYALLIRGTARSALLPIRPGLGSQTADCAFSGDFRTDMKKE